jgi:hypothetical protein
MDPMIQRDLYNRLTSRKFLLTVVVFLFAFGGWAGGQITYAEFLDVGWKVAAVFFGAEGATDAFAMLRSRSVVPPAPDSVTTVNVNPATDQPVETDSPRFVNGG